MENLPKYYTVLFNAVTDALHLLEKGDVGSAKGMLIWGQQQAEEAYLSGESNPRGCRGGCVPVWRGKGDVGSAPCSDKRQLFSSRVGADAHIGPPVRTTHRKFRIAL